MRLDDGAMGNLKILRLSNSAFRLWINGLCYCQRHLTDGLIPREALGELKAKRRDVDALTKPQVIGKAPLWGKVDGFGFQVHDFLDWNDSKEVVEKKREDARLRMQRSRKHGDTRTERAPLVAANVVSGVDLSSSLRKETSIHKPPQLAEAPDAGLAERAANLLETYGALYAKHRNGARMLRLGNSLDWSQAVEICRTWDDQRLAKMIAIFLTTDEPWIAGTERHWRLFVTKATWADDRLSAWEADQARRA